MTMRRFWLKAHLYIALTLGLVLVLVAVTGSLLVWSESLDRHLEPQRYATSGAALGLSPAGYLAAGAVALGTVTPSTLRLPATPGDPVAVAGPLSARAPNGQPELLTAWLDPPTGRVLDVANAGESATVVLHRLHGRLLLPGVGRQLVGWTGVFMLVLSLSGFYLWWPRGGLRFSRALGWRKGLRPSTNLHHLVGFWISIPLAVLSFTGIYISFPQTSRAALAIFTDVGPQAARRGGGAGEPKRDGETWLGIDAAVARATTGAEGATLAAVMLPTAESPDWRVQFRRPDAPQPVTVRVNDTTGEVAADAARAPSTGDRSARLMRRLHDGTDMGIGWQVLIFAGGLSPLLLMVTGVLMWLRQRRRERMQAQKHAAVAEAS